MVRPPRVIGVGGGWEEREEGEAENKKQMLKKKERKWKPKMAEKSGRV